MRIWLINHFAVPIKYYPLARTTNFAKYLIREGHEVKIFCASSVHNSDINLIENGALYKEETIDGIPYIYVRARSYKTKIQRVLNMLDFAWNLKTVCDRYEKPDVILASSQTPFACMRALGMAKQMKTKGIMEVTDLWPESLVAYGIINKSNPMLFPMYLFEKKMYEYADEIIFSFEGGYDYIEERGWAKDIPRDKVHYINNGVDLEVFDYNREHYHIDDDDLNNDEIFKVVYTGSVRRVNNLGKLLDIAKLLTNPKIKFLIWGKGDEVSILEKRVTKERIDNVAFKGYVDKKYVPNISSRADLNIAHNSPSPVFRFGTSFNKFFDYMAAGKPILADFPSKYNPVTETGAGIDIQNPAVENIAKTIEDFVDMAPEIYEKYCQNARKGAEMFDFKNLTKKLLTIMAEE